MIVSPAIEPPAIIEEVRWRKQRRVIIKAAKPKPVVKEQKEETPTNPLCTEASPEYCDPDPPVVIMERVLVNPNTFIERWEPFPVPKGDRLK